MRAIICSGVTAGHINPAIAIANEIVLHEPDSSILFAIFPEGMEERLISQAGYDYVKISTRPFVRSFSPRGLYWNMRTAAALVKATRQTRRLVRDFKPDVMIGFGGFTSGPVLLQGARMGIPTVIHESNAFPGMANKLLAKHVDLILLGMEAVRSRFPSPEKCVFTGNPVRQDVLTADRARERAARGIGANDLCILSMGGSNGARQLNAAIAAYLAASRGRSNYIHYHSTGSIEYDSFMRQLDELGVDLKQLPQFHISEYINDVPQCLAAADLVVARSGSMTVTEIAASGSASVLIPSPNVTENHQYFNALALEQIGAAKLIEEKDLTAELLRQTIDSLSRNDLKLMGVRARSLAVPDSSRQIYRRIRKLLDEKSGR